jgi:hypothetical protein
MASYSDNSADASFAGTTLQTYQTFGLHSSTGFELVANGAGLAL